MSGETLNPYLPDDFVKGYDLADSDQRATAYAIMDSRSQDEWQRLVWAYRGMLEEVVEVNGHETIDVQDCLGVPFESAGSLVADRKLPRQGVLHRYIDSNRVLMTPGEHDYRDVLTSRTLGAMSRNHLSRLQDEGNSLVIGLSTGGNVGAMLGKMGIRMVGYDGDAVSLSNLGRLMYASALDVGSPKAEVLARHLVELDPFADFALYPYHLRDIGEMDEQIAEANLIIDAADGRIKHDLRVHAARQGKGVLMGTNSGHQAIVTYGIYPEGLGLPDDVIDQIEADYRTKTMMATEVIGRGNPASISSPLLTTFTLAGENTRQFWGQTGPTATATAAMGAHAAVALLLGGEIPAMTMYDLSDGWTAETSTMVTDDIFRELADEFPRLYKDFYFSGEVTLVEAAARVLREKLESRVS